MTPILRRLGKNLSWLVLGNAVTRGVALLLVAVVARTLGAASVGVLTIALGAAMVAVPLFTLGQVELLIRESARTPERTRQLLAAARRDQYRLLLWGLPIAAAATLVVGDPALRWTLLALVPYVLLRVETVTRAALFTGLDRMEVGTQARAIELFVALALVVAAGYLGLPLWTVGPALATGAALSLAWLVRKQRELPGSRVLSPLPSLLAQSLPFLGQGVALQLLLRSDAFLLAALGVSREEIGHFGAAAAVVWGLLAAAQMLAVALYPTFSRRAATGREPAAAALAAACLGLAVGLLAVAGVWWLRAPLVSLFFGPAFLPSLPLLERLLWALPTASASMVVGVVVASWRRQHQGFVLLCFTLGASLLLNLLWIPEHGAAGAANAAVVAHAFGALGTLVIAAWPTRAAAAALEPTPDER